MDKDSKEEARRIVRARLDGVAPREYAASAGAACGYLRTLLAELHDGGRLNSVLSYRAAANWREIDVSSLEGVFKNVRFDYVPVDSYAPFPEKAYDAVLVPLYGFGTGGYRLGHGGGWYDRFLSQQPRALKIGVGLEAGRIGFASEAHDIPMDIIVTEAGLTRRDVVLSPTVL